MTKAGFKRVYKKAIELIGCKYNEAEAQEAYRNLEGCGLPGEKRICTVTQAAYLLNWQCLNLNGVYESKELEQLREALLTNVTLID